MGVLTGLSPTLVRGGRAQSQASALLGARTNGLAADFTDQSMIVRDVGTPANAFVGNPNSKVTYASPSTKYILSAINAYGSGTTLRTEYDSSGLPIGVRIEPAATNIALQSNALTNIAWVGDNASAANPTVTDNFAASHDGTANASRLQMNRGAGTFSRLTQSITGTAGQTYATSASLRSNTGASQQLSIRIGAESGSGAILRTAGTAWARREINYLLPDTNASFQYLSWSAAGGDVSVDVLTWCQQVELGTFATSPIPTTTGTVTRNADNITLATSAYPHASMTTCTIRGRTASGINSANQVLWQVDDGTESNRLRIVRDTSLNLRFIVTTAGVEQANLNLGAVAHSTAFSVTVTWATNNFSASLNGGAPITDVAGTVPTVTTLRLGSSATGEQWAGHLRSIVMVP